MNKLVILCLFLGLFAQKAKTLSFDFRPGYDYPPYNGDNTYGLITKQLIKDYTKLLAKHINHIQGWMDNYYNLDYEPELEPEAMNNINNNEDGPMSKALGLGWRNLQGSNMIFRGDRNRAGKMKNAFRGCTDPALCRLIK